MHATMTLVYWKTGRLWVGKLLEHPEVMTQGETLEELEQNIREAYLLLALEDVPAGYGVKTLSL